MTAELFLEKVGTIPNGFFDENFYQTTTYLLQGKKKVKCFQPDLNWRPSACEADVITTTLRKPQLTHALLFICFVCFESIYD